MKLTCFAVALAAVSLISTQAGATTISLIGLAGSGAINDNGDLEDLTGASPVGAGALTNATASIANRSSSSVGQGVAIPGFQIERSQAGNFNTAIGFTNSTGTDLDPTATNTSASANNGNFLLSADTIDLGFTPQDGGSFTLSFDYAVDPGNTNAPTGGPDFTITTLLTAGGVALTPDSTVLAPASPGGVSVAGSVITLATDAAGGVVNVTQTFTLNGATDGLVDLSIDAGENVLDAENDFDRVAIDNIVLSADVTAVPEPGAALLALMGLTFAGAAGMRRRLG